MNLSNIITTILTDPEILKPIVEAVRKELAADDVLHKRVVALEEARADDILHKRVLALEQAVAHLTKTEDWEISANQIEGLDQFIRDQLEQDGVDAEHIKGLDRIVKDIEIRADDIVGMERAIKDALEDITFKLTVD